MKPWIAIMSVLCASGVCRATLDFSAYRSIANEASFVITDLDDRKSSEWIAAGQSFAGYTLVAFDSGTETLSVRKGDLKLDLHLKDSHVRNDDAPPLSPADRHQGLLARYARNTNVALVQLRFEKESVYITAKEVWKGTDYPVGVTLKVPRKTMLGDSTPLEDGVEAKVISAPVLSEVLAGHDSRIIAGTDGVNVAGPPGFSLDEFRAYFHKEAGAADGLNSDAHPRAERKEPAQPPEPTPTGRAGAA